MELTLDEWWLLTGPGSRVDIVNDCTAVTQDRQGVVPDQVVLVIQSRATKLAPDHRHALQMTPDVARQIIAVLAAALDHDDGSSSG